MKKINFNQEDDLCDELWDELKNELRNKLWNEIYWNLKQPIRRIS